MRLPLLAVTLLLLACRSPLDAEGTGPTKQELLAYLEAASGSTILAGQMDLTWSPTVDMAARVKATTGKAPALMGYDFMDATDRGTRRHDADGQVSEALAWASRGGIVTFCWHWRDPSGVTNSFYRNSVHIPLKNGLFDPDAEPGRAMRQDIDFIASELTVLRDAGVTVLWRPLHEGGGNGAANGSGAWFWWGQDGAAAYVALYRYLHDRLTVVHGLDNLIWVWNGQGEAYFPGEEYVDVAGQDVYERHHGSQQSWDSTLRSWSGKTLTALTEVGAIPDPQRLKEDAARFSWFLVWNDNPVVSLARAADNFWSGSGSLTEDAVNYPWNTPSFERQVYNSPGVITLEELPWN